MKCFISEKVFGLDWEGINLYGEKHFRETNNSLCKVSTAENKMIVYTKFYLL